MGLPVFDHQDLLQEIDKNIPLSEKLLSIHRVLQHRFAFIDRIAVAIYDDKTDLLKTFLHSSGPDRPLSLYQSKLTDAPSLREILEKRRPRVVNNIDIFANGKAEHTQKIQTQGYKASYTMPMYLNDVFFGFLFFNSYQADAFDTETLHYLDIFGHLISVMIVNEQTNIRTLMATVKTAHDMTHHRDGETGAHIDRMARFSRLIARTLAPKYALSDEFVEHVFMFAPLHDIGKISIPDAILLKKGKLTEREFAFMQNHTSKGREIIDNMIDDFDLSGLQHISILRNIAELHHEAVNGSGYPKGLKGDAIPLEARIVAVADVFDALTSERPYKPAWHNDQAFAMLQRLADNKLDRECVQVLIDQRQEVEQIQAQFTENRIG